jgi:hypothetical protein
MMTDERKKERNQRGEGQTTKTLKFAKFNAFHFFRIPDFRLIHDTTTKFSVVESAVASRSDDSVPRTGTGTWYLYLYIQ